MELKARQSLRGCDVCVGGCVWHLYRERLNGKDAVDWRVRSRQLQLGPHDGGAGDDVLALGLEDGVALRPSGEVPQHLIKHFHTAAEEIRQRFRYLNMSE